MSEVMRYETDIVRLVHDNQTGQMCRVKPDGDGLGLVEIDGGDDFGRLTLAPEMALVIAEAIRQCASEMLGVPS